LLYLTRESRGADGDGAGPARSDDRSDCIAPIGIE